MALTSTARTRTRDNRLPAVQAGSPLPTRERRPGYIALAVVLIVGLAAVGAWLYAGAGAKVPVLMINKELQAGQVIQRSDLTIISVAGDGRLSAMSSDRIGQVTGRAAAMRLVADSLLLPAMVRAPGAQLATGVVQVGIAVKPGQAPAGGLLPGDKVSVFALPDPGAADGVAVKITAEITGGVSVSAVRANPAETGGTLLTLDIPITTNTTERDAVTGAIATAAAAGRISLVKAAGA